MSNLNFYSFKKLYFFFIFFIISLFSKIKAKEIDLSLKLYLQLNYGLNNNVTDVILQSSESEIRNKSSPMDIFFDIIRKNFHNLLKNYDKEYDYYELNNINKNCLEFFNSTFVNYTGEENSSISNYYILKLLEDSSKKKNDLGLYDQCFQKIYKFAKPYDLTEYFIAIFDKSGFVSKNSAFFDHQNYFLGFCLPKNDVCSEKDLSHLVYSTVLGLNNVLNLKSSDNIDGLLLTKDSSSYELKDILNLIPLIIIFLYIIFVLFSYKIFSLSEKKDEKKIKNFSNKEIEECFNWKENLYELVNFKLTYTKINNFSGLTYIKGIRGIAMFHIILGFTFFALINSPVRLFGDSFFSHLFKSTIYPIIMIGIKYSPGILFSCSGYCLNYKLMCYFDDKSDNHMKLIPFILYQSHKYIMLIFTILFCKFSFFTLFKFLDNPLWFFFEKYFCDRPKINNWKFYLSFFLIPSFSFDRISRNEENIFDYLWIVNNEIIFFLFGSLIIFACSKFKFRNDIFSIILILIIYVFKIIYCLRLDDFYPTIYYYFFDYGKLMTNPIFNLSYFLIGMLFGSVNFTIQKGIVVSNLNESNEIKNKPYLILPCKIVNFFKSCSNFSTTILIFVSMITALLISGSIFLVNLFKKDLDDLINSKFLNKFLIFDNEIIVIIVHLIAVIFYIKGVNLINDFFSYNFWLMLNRFYFSFILTINIIILFVIFTSETMIIFSAFNIILYSLICGFLIFIFSILLYVFIELPFKKILKILIRKWQYKEEIDDKKNDDEENDFDDDDD